MRVIVYTAITAGKDVLKDNQVTDGADFVAFLDANMESQVWDTRKACSKFVDPCRNAKIHKLLPHQYFPEYDYSLWLDGAVELKAPVRELIDKYLQRYDLALFRHPFEHDCIYTEAEICKRLGLDDPRIIDEQMSRYRQDGFPERAGLAECTVLLRRHTEKMNKFNELWWREVEKGSRRDQLSFNYLVWKHDFRFDYFPGQVQDDPEDTRKNGNSYFQWHQHLR